MRQPFFLLIVALLMTFFAMGVLNSATMQDNLAGQQAISFLNGKLDIPDTVQNRNNDGAIYNGKAYSPFPPLPALVMIPFMVVFGYKAPMTIIMIPIFVMLGLFFWRILLISKEIAFPKYWLLFAFLFGSPVWPTLMYGYGVWYSSQLLGTMFVVIGLWASMANFKEGWRGPLYIGISLTCAFLCRQSTILLTPVFLVFLWGTTSQITATKIRTYLLRVIPVAACLSIGIVVYLLFNYLRFGHVLDTGYEYIVPGGALGLRIDTYGLFSPKYVLFNVTYFFLQGMHIQFGGPDMLQVQGIDLFGTALLVASPFLIAAFYARPSRLILIPAWFGIAAMVIYEMLYHNNGYVQINSHRFSLDYLPILMLLAAWGSSKFPKSFIKGTIFWAVGCNVFALLVAILSYGIPK